MSRLIVASCLLACALPAADTRAQDDPAGPPGGRRDELVKMIDAYIVANLQESLGLSDEQFVKVLPLVKRVQTERRSFVERRHRLLFEMRGSLESGRATEARIGELLKELKALELEEPAAVRKQVDALDAQLTPLQQAKLRVLQLQVEQKIREVMQRARQERQRERRRDAPPPR